MAIFAPYVVKLSVGRLASSWTACTRPRTGWRRLSSCGSLRLCNTCYCAVTNATADAAGVHGNEGLSSTERAHLFATEYFLRSLPTFITDMNKIWRNLNILSKHVPEASSLARSLSASEEPSAPPWKPRAPMMRTD